MRAMFVVYLVGILATIFFLMATVWVLQRGSPESKPVGAAHSDTGIEG